MGTRTQKNVVLFLIQAKSLGTVGQVTLYCTSRKARHWYAHCKNWKWCLSSISEENASVSLFTFHKITVAL